MKRIAKFHKVSFEQFAKDWKDTFEQYSEEELRNIYDSLKLPKRATTGSAGYDFYAPVDVTMKPGEITQWESLTAIISFPTTKVISLPS